jgi:endonuclease YncB( thermonuclease family)
MEIVGVHIPWRATARAAALALAALLAAPAAAETCAAVDGDTLRCGDRRVRLADVDAPEMGGCAPDGSDAAGRARRAGRPLTPRPRWCP